MFIIDTNFLMKDYKSLSLLDGDICIPITVIRELDNHKNDQGPVGYNSRHSLKIINEAIDRGYVLSNSSKLFIDENEYPETTKNDDKIIQSAILIENAVLITNDVAMKVVAKSKGVNVRMFSDSDEEVLNPGKVEELVIDYELLTDIFNHNEIDFKEIYDGHTNLNSCYLVRDENRTGSALIRRIGSKFIKMNQPKNVYGKVTGKNVGQRFYLDMLLDPKIKIVLVNGVAGSGKTLLALAAACQLRDSRKFENIVCAKSVEEVGKEIGFRPGDESEKLGPYYAAFGDNLEYLASADIKGGRCEKMIPEVTYEHIGYMRGRTFRSSYIIVDECQNLTPKDIKTVISRAGEGSKVVCCGDLHQIDNNQSEYTNGLFYAQRKLVNQELVGIISLDKSERSDIAKLSALL